MPCGSNTWRRLAPRSITYILPFGPYGQVHYVLEVVGREGLAVLGALAPGAHNVAVGRHNDDAVVFAVAYVNVAVRTDGQAARALEGAAIAENRVGGEDAVVGGESCTGAGSVASVEAHHAAACMQGVGAEQGAVTIRCGPVELKVAGVVGPLVANLDGVIAGGESHIARSGLSGRSCWACCPRPLCRQ